MVAMIVVASLVACCIGRVPALILVLGSLSAFVIVEPALLTAGAGAFMVAGLFLFVCIQWLYPAITDGVKPVRLLWITSRFTLALTYA